MRYLNEFNEVNSFQDAPHKDKILVCLSSDEALNLLWIITEH
jgi:hypothetical protein